MPHLFCNFSVCPFLFSFLDLSSYACTRCSSSYSSVYIYLCVFFGFLLPVFFVSNFLLSLFFILLIILFLSASTFISFSYFVCSFFSSFCFVFFSFFLHYLADCWLIVCLSHRFIRPSLGRSPTIIGYPAITRPLSDHRRLSGRCSSIVRPQSTVVRPPRGHYPPLATAIRPLFGHYLAFTWLLIGQ